MRKKHRFILLLIIFFCLFLSKDFLFGLFIPRKDITVTSNTNIDDYIKAKELISNDNYYLGRILYQNPYKFQQELFVSIDTSNISKNDYVINEDGLIGIVDKVYKNRIITKLLTAHDIILQVRINNCYGLLLYDKNVIVKNINNYCKVNLDDEVYTSNLGYLKNEIYIGKVSKILKDKNEITNDYVIDIGKRKYLFSQYVVVISRDKE